MKCLICEREIKNHNALGIHIVKTHNISSKEYYDKYLKKENEGICIICGKETSFINLKKGYRLFCSRQCLTKSDYKKRKTKETNLKRYGVENPFQSEDIKERIKNTNLLKYGVENPSQCKEIREKQKQTCLEHYGVENPFKNKEIKEKIKQSWLVHYGVDYPLQNKEVYKKVKQSHLEHYGVEHYSRTSEYKEKKKNETIEKYKKEFPQLNIIDYDINTTIMTCYCNECERNYNIKLLMLGSRLRHLKYKNPCTNCFQIDGHYSNEEKELVDYIKSIYDGEIIENDRSVLNGQELDVYLPEKKIAFEYNGLYWHSSEQKDKYYHYNKTLECEKQNIQLVHIFENEWKENKENIKCYIKDIINDIINIENYLKIFLKENNKIIVNRQFSNGKLLEFLGYKLKKTFEPKNEIINVNEKTYEIYNCGYLEYIKE